MLGEIACLRQTPEMEDAFLHLNEKDINRGAYEYALYHRDFATVAEQVHDYVKRNRWKQVVKKMLQV